MPDIENVYPAEFHFRIIANAQSAPEDGIRSFLADYDVTSPLESSQLSKGEKYRSFAVSVRVSSREEHDTLDKGLRLQDGVKIVL